MTHPKPIKPSLVDKNDLDGILKDLYYWGVQDAHEEASGVDHAIAHCSEAELALQNLIADKVNEALTSELNAMPNHTSVENLEWMSSRDNIQHAKDERAKKHLTQ